MLKVLGEERGDGVTELECAELFERIDINGDGFVTTLELTEFARRWGDACFIMSLFVPCMFRAQHCNKKHPKKNCNKKQQEYKFSQ